MHWLIDWAEEGKESEADCACLITVEILTLFVHFHFPDIFSRQRLTRFLLNVLSHSFKIFMPISFYEGNMMTLCTLNHRITAPRQLVKSKPGAAFTFWLPLLERNKKPSSTSKGAFLLWNAERNSFQLPFERHKSQISTLLLGAAVTFCFIDCYSQTPLTDEEYNQ